MYKHHGTDTVSVLSIIFAHPWALESSAPIPFLASASPQISYSLLLLICSCFAPCSCFAHCCHDPFTVRSAVNLSTVPWFHSVCASVSMFMIADNCLFLSLGRCLNTTTVSVQTSRPLHLHRSSVHTKSVCTRSAYLLKCAHQESADLSRQACAKSPDFAPDPSLAGHPHLVVECGIHGL